MKQSQATNAIVDKHVGEQIRKRRTMLNMSQAKLGDAVGVTFQQVQKYEKGKNRVGASRLQQIANVLQVPPASFFDDTSDITPKSWHGAKMEKTGTASAEPILTFVATSEGLALSKAFTRIANQQVRRRIVDLVGDLAGRNAPLEADEND
jgi:transcriptional regulator with XRE-family HTH domain